MKKLLYNNSRTKIFNLDHVISIERAEDKNFGKYMILKFSGTDFFIIFPSDKVLQCYDEIRSKCQIGMFGNLGIDDIPNVVHLCLMNGHYDCNKKLFEFFEHKFTRSSLCQHQD